MSGAINPGDPRRGLLDPWTDAAEIARRLAAPGARLLIMLGAQSWCRMCRDFYPEFVALAQHRSDPDATWLWLDLDEHAEFIGDFIPDGLPLLLSYQSGALQASTLVTRANAAALIAGARNLGATSVTSVDADPGIWRRLTQLDWASG